MDILRSMSSHKPSAIEVMFSTHPMSDERYQTAVNASQSTYGFGLQYPLNRERYMDYTASLRQMGGAIEEMQTGEGLMMQEQYAEAEGYFYSALRQAPNDYAGLVLMAKCLVAQERYDQAQQYARAAQQIYPAEAQGFLVGGVASLNRKDFGSAYEEFAAFDQRLPGNPDITFFKGYSQEGMQHKQEAAEEYNRYLQIVNEGDQAQHAYQRLVEWGYVQP
jgi:tetratricopeptide (TPR) repeat protein